MGQGKDRKNFPRGMPETERSMNCRKNPSRGRKTEKDRLPEDQDIINIHDKGLGVTGSERSSCLFRLPVVIKCGTPRKSNFTNLMISQKEKKIKQKVMFLYYCLTVRF